MILTVLKIKSVNNQVQTNLIEIGNVLQKKVERINRVVYDLSSKPFATINKNILIYLLKDKIEVF